MTKPPSSRMDALPAWFFKALLVSATIIWGSAFVVMKDAVDTFAPATLIGVRFAVAALLVLVCFRKRIRRSMDKRHVYVGLLLGVLYFTAYWVQTIGLTDTTPGKNAFLTATYCVMVPFVYWIVSRRKPHLMHLVAALLCIVGVWMVSMDGGSFDLRFGDAMTILCAVCFAFHIACLAKFAQTCDIFTITFIQFAVCGIAGLAIGLATEPQPDASLFGPMTFVQLAFLAVCASFLACLFQNVGQTRVPPSQASLLMSLESVFGVLFSVLFYGESLTLRLIIGFVLIFIAIVASEGLADKEWPWTAKKKTSSS